MTTPLPLPFGALDEDEVELTAVDLGLARAFWEGVPTARLLARIRMDRDARDLVDLDERASGVDFDDASWDMVLAQLLAASHASLDRVKKAVARHTRAAFDEGPLEASDSAIAALTHALLSSADADASPAEGAADAHAIDEAVRVACARFDARLGRLSGDRRAAPFEACLELARRDRMEPWPLGVTRATLDALATASGVGSAIVPASAALYPWGETDVPLNDRRACLLERSDLERALLRPEREPAASVTRAAQALLPDGAPLERIAGDARALLSRHGALLLVQTEEPRSRREAPPLPPSSWQPADFAGPSAAEALAAALERGAVTVPRARSLVLRGGEEALDAVGKEMLEVRAHPFASAVFAEILAAVSRERDVVRLVSYFAIAPDPRVAAKALSTCRATELSTVLKAWLETMLPADGSPPSAGERVASCIAALEPYPALYAVVRPLLADAPPSK